MVNPYGTLTLLERIPTQAWHTVNPDSDNQIFKQSRTNAKYI